MNPASKPQYRTHAVTTEVFLLIKHFHRMLNVTVCFQKLIYRTFRKRKTFLAIIAGPPRVLNPPEMKICADQRQPCPFNGGGLTKDAHTSTYTPFNPLSPHATQDVGKPVTVITFL